MGEKVNSFTYGAAAVDYATITFPLCEIGGPRIAKDETAAVLSVTILILLLPLLI